MRSIAIHYFAALAVISMHNMISPVKCQCTVKGCESGDSSSSIVTEIGQMFVEVHERLQEIDRRSQEQDIYIKKVLSDDERMNSINESLQQMKNKQDTIVTSLRTNDRRSQDQVQGLYEFLNATLEQMKNQQDVAMKSLHAVDRRSQEQDIYIKQVQSIHERLNESYQQMKTWHDFVKRRFDVVTQLLFYHDSFIKNQTYISWKLNIGVPFRPEVDVDLPDGFVMLPSRNNWIILMDRFDGSEDFNRSWTEYKNGFGDVGQGEFWLGNEIVHRLTNRSGVVYTLRIEVYINKTWFFAEYSTFSVDSESTKYTLHLKEYSGNAGDSLTGTYLATYERIDGMGFTTRDSDNDGFSSGNCAYGHPGGWWFNYCQYGCLTCLYNNKFRWDSLKHMGSDGQGLLQAARMMIKSRRAQIED